jgi:hypothetical protein
MYEERCEIEKDWQRGVRGWWLGAEKRQNFPEHKEENIKKKYGETKDLEQNYDQEN